MPAAAPDDPVRRKAAGDPLLMDLSGDDPVEYDQPAGEPAAEGWGAWGEGAAGSNTWGYGPLTGWSPYSYGYPAGAIAPAGGALPPRLRHP